MKKVVTYKEKKERYCRNCGGVVGKKDKVCPNCGWDFKSKLKTTIDGGYKTSNAIVYGVLSIVFSFFPFVGIVLGIMAMVSGVTDIDKRAVRAAKANAEEAGVIDDIDIICKDMNEWMPGDGIPRAASKDDFGVIISNLPYGIRIGDNAANRGMYAHFRELMKECPNWSCFLITADKSLEREIGRKADRRRKLYNGQIETQFYQFHGARPQKK